MNESLCCVVDTEKRVGGTYKVAVPYPKTLRATDLRGDPRSRLRGEPVRISSMVLFVAYAFYYRNAFSIIIYHHMPRERRCLRRSGAQQSHLPAEFLSNRRTRRRGMAASNPLHRNAVAGAGAREATLGNEVGDGGGAKRWDLFRSMCSPSEPAIRKWEGAGS